MSSTQIRGALTSVADAVEAPPVDGLEFERRVRLERRRRTTRRGLVAAAAAVAMVAASGIVLHETSGTSRGAGPAGTVREASPIGVAVLAEGRRLFILLPDGGGASPAALSVQEVLGRTDGGAVVLDDRDRVAFIPLTGEGVPGPARALADGRPVLRAWLDADGDLAWIDRDHRLQVRPIMDGHDSLSVPLRSGWLDLVSTDGDRWVEVEDGRVVVHTDSGSDVLDPDTEPTGTQLAGGTLVVRTDAGVEFWDPVDATRRFTYPTGPVGSLSPDGRSYATYADHQLVVLGTSDGQVSRMGDLPLATPVAMTWQDDDRFLVRASTTSQMRSGPWVVFDCSVALGTCKERYAGNVQIATR